MSQVLEETLIKPMDGWKKEETYIRIKQEATTTWPDWKKAAYNEMFAFSNHATKLTLGSTVQQ